MKLFLTFFATLIISSTYGQTNCQGIIQENEKLKNLLGLYNGHKIETATDIEFSFFKATGNIKDQTIWVEFLVKNINPIHQKIYISQIDYIDEFSTSHTGDYPQLGNNYYSTYNDVYSQIPIKVTTKISKVVPSTMSYVKAITIKFNTEGNSSSNVAITGDKIVWK